MNIIQFPGTRGSATKAADPQAGVNPGSPPAAATIGPDHPYFLTSVDMRAPRYTSYPTADRFGSGFGAQDYAEHLRHRLNEQPAPLSLYVHVPFCQSLCWYCGCNKQVTRDYSKAEAYLSAVEAELDLVLAHLNGDRRVSQLHWGGGTPTYLSEQDIVRLLGSLRRRLPFVDGGEFSIEIDPRSARDSKLRLLVELGFNRMSLGVQDIDPEVQQAINRIQPAGMTEHTIEVLRGAGIDSINLDLIYGLPHQTPDRFEKTLEWIEKIRPERIALYNYAHLPSRFTAQRLIRDEDLPDAIGKLEIFRRASEHLIGAGYVHIGMDHFALPDDELAVAQRAGQLHRNFQGYSTQPDCDVISLGASAISKVGACYAQNLRGTKEYMNCVAKGQIPVFRGYELDRDDQARRAVIMDLMCRGRVDIEHIERDWRLEFTQYFRRELEQLAGLAAQGFATVGPQAIEVTPSGYRILRTIGAVFDRHLQRNRDNTVFSRVI